MERQRDPEAPPAGAHPRRAPVTLPACLRLANSPVHGVGVFAAVPLARGLRMGPYEGRPARADNTGAGYSWRVRHGRLVDADNDAHSSWMQFVNCTPQAARQNLAGFQHRGALYFRTVAPVAISEELLIYYGDDYASVVDTDGYYDYHPPVENLESELAATNGDSSDYTRHSSVDTGYYDYVVPKEEPEAKFAVTDGDGGDGGAGNDYARHMSVDANDYCDYVSPKEEPEPKFAATDSDGGNRGSGDDIGIDADRYYDYVASKDEPEPKFPATDCDSGNGGPGDDCVHHIGVDADRYYDSVPPKEEPGTKFAATDGDSGYVVPKEEPKPEFGSCDGNVNGDYVSPDADGYCDYKLPKEDPEPEFVEVSYNPLKKEPGSELGDGAADNCGRDVGYACSHCGVNLGTQEFKVEHELRCKAQMQRRELESQVTAVYVCDYCKCSFINKEYKEKHQLKWCRKRPVATKRRIGFKGTYFECDKCEYVTKRKRNLERHVLNHNKKDAEWFTCTECSYKTVHKRDVTEHMRIHNSSSSCCCPICGKSYTKKRFVDNHLLKQHSDEWDEVSKLITSEIYTCDICDEYRTTSKPNFIEHVTVTHEKGVGCQKYECPRCPFYSFRKSSLTKHSKTHLEQKNYRCTTCKKQFTQKLHLDSHVLHNHAENVDLVKTITAKIHRCELCSFKTVVVTHLRSHVDADNEANSNWMRFVNCTPHAARRNLAGFQYRGALYYRTVAPVAVGDELLVYYGDDYARNVDIDGFYDYRPPMGNPELEPAATGDASNTEGDDFHFHVPLKEEPEPELAAADGVGGANDEYAHRIGIHADGYYVAPKEEPKPKFAAMDGGGGNEGGADDNYACNIGMDDYCDPPKKDPEPEFVDVSYPPIKEEPEPELCDDDGDGDAFDIDGRYGSDPLKKELEMELSATSDDAVTDDSQDVGYCNPPKDEPEFVVMDDDAVTDDGIRDASYDCSRCGVKLYTQELKVEHELRCKVHMKQKELESQATKLYNCGYCGFVFVKKEDKEQHQLRWCPKKPVLEKKDFECDKCNYVTKWKQSFERHVLNHNKINNNKWYTCTQCSHKTMHKYDLTRHMKIHENSLNSCCLICEKRFKRKQCLDDHLLKQHSDESDDVSKLITSKIYTCNICDKYRTTRKSDFTDHITLTHHESVGYEKYECPRCPYSTLRRSSLKKHSKTHLEQKDYQCTVCQQQFIQKTQLDSHILHNHADNIDLMKTITSKIHRCELCAFKTVVLTNLKTHERSEHSITISCTCPICGKTFKKKRCLDDHLLKQHSDEPDKVSKLITTKIHTCNICNQYRTTSKEKFNEHVGATHLKGAVSQKSDFNDHITLTHHKGVGFEKYECPHCSYSTFRKAYLKKHAKTHLEQKDFRCVACNQQFIQKMQLDSHILHNHADNIDLMKTITLKIHRCELCPFKSVVSTNLRKHVQSKHM